MANNKQKFTAEVFQLCDYTIFAQGGKFSILGIFDTIFVTNLPAGHPKMVVASIISGEATSECSLKVDFVEPDGQISKENKPITMNIRLGPNGKSNVANEYIGFRITTAGAYKVRLHVNGDIIKEIPLYVRKIAKNEHPGSLAN